MIERFCAAVLLVSLIGCGSSGDGGEGVPDAVEIRVPAFDAGAGAPSEGAPEDVAEADDPDGAAGDATPSAPEASPAPDEDRSSAAPAEEPVPPTVAADGTPLPPEVDERLRGVFDLVNADAVEFAVAVARRLVDVEVGPRAGFTFSRSGVDEATGVENVTLLCPEGGTLDTFSSSLLSVDGVYVLRACDVGPLVLDGRIEGRVRGPDRENDGEPWDEPNHEFDAFSIVDRRDGRLISIDTVRISPVKGSTTVAGGDVMLRFGYGRLTGYDSRASIGPGSIFDRRPERTITAVGTLDTRTRTDATTAYPLGGLTTRFDVRFGDDPERVEVRTVAPFAGLDPDGRFARGSLTVTAEDYVYTLDADSGDAASFRLDVAEDAVTTSYTVPWSAALGFDALEPERIDVGF